MNLSAQVIDTVTYEYCEITSFAKVASALSNVDEANIFINFGNGITFTPENPMKDKGGNSLLFKNPIDAINYLAKSKWTLSGSTAYFVDQGMSSRNAKHYILSRPKYRNK